MISSRVLIERLWLYLLGLSFIGSLCSLLGESLLALDLIKVKQSTTYNFVVYLVRNHVKHFFDAGVFSKGYKAEASRF